MPIQPSLKPETVKKGQFEVNIFFQCLSKLKTLKFTEFLKDLLILSELFLNLGIPTHTPLLMSGSVFFIRPAVIELSRPSAIVEIMLFSVFSLSFSSPVDHLAPGWAGGSVPDILILQ